MLAANKKGTTKARSAAPSRAREKDVKDKSTTDKARRAGGNADKKDAKKQEGQFPIGESADNDGRKVPTLSNPSPVQIKRLPGRPKGTPDRWTPEYIAEVVADMQRYTDDNDFPTEAEFCYTRGIHPQRFRDIPELMEAKDMMFAKRQAMTIKRGLLLGAGEGALGSFLAKLAANSGPFSLVDKQELTGRDGDAIPVSVVKRVVVDAAKGGKSGTGH